MIWWIIGTYLLIGIATTLTSSLGEENRAIMRANNIQWPHIVIGIFIGPVCYLYIQYENIKKARKNG